MSRFVIGLGLALVLAAALLISAPARILSLVVPGQRVVLDGFSGTLWRGAASRCMVRTDPGYLHLGRVQWSLDPLSLLLLAPRLSIESEWGRQLISAELVLRSNEDVDLNQVDATLSADLLRQIAPVAVMGQFLFQLEYLRMRDGLPHATNGRLVWQDGAWQSPQGVLPLGTYVVELQQEPGQALRGEVLTLSGAVPASGEVQLQEKEYSVDILVSRENRLDPQVAQALSLIATPESAGFRVKLEGSL